MRMNFWKKLKIEKINYGYFGVKLKEKFKLGEIKPGESAYIGGIVPKGDFGEMVLNYGDKYGNEYETRVIINFKEKKIIKQEFKKLKVVKDIGDNYPKLELDENSID